MNIKVLHISGQIVTKTVTEKVHNIKTLMVCQGLSCNFKKNLLGVKTSGLFFFNNKSQKHSKIKIFLLFHFHAATDQI